MEIMAIGRINSVVSAVRHSQWHFLAFVRIHPVLTLLLFFWQAISGRHRTLPWRIQGVSENMHEMYTWLEDMQQRANRLVTKRTEVEEGGRIKIMVATTIQRRIFWQRFRVPFPVCSVAANKLLSVHVTTAAAERNWSAWGRTYTAISE